MNRNFLKLAGTLILILLVGFAWFSVADAAVYSSISGHVIAEDTGKGVPGMRIDLQQGDREKGAYTDANGFYIFSDLYPGEYKLGFESISLINSIYYIKDGEVNIRILPGKNIIN